MLLQEERSVSHMTSAQEPSGEPRWTVAADKALQLYDLARSHLHDGNFEDAIQCFLESAKCFPHFKTYELLGEQCLLRGDFSNAVLYLSAASGLGVRPFKAKYLLAKALVEIGDSRLAVSHLREALSINPRYKAAEMLLKEIGAVE